MARISLLLAAASIGVILPGCAYLHHPENEKLAVDAKAAFAEANIGKALDAERNALLKQHDIRQDLVRQTQTAIRDTALANVINQPDAAAMAANLQERADARIKKLVGKPIDRALADCPSLLKDVQTAYGDAVTKLEFAADALRLMLAKDQVKTELSCKSIPTLLPVAQRSPVNLALAKAYDELCSPVTKQAACLAEFASSDSAMGELAGRLDAIATEQATAATNAAAAKAIYEKLLAEAKDAKPRDGAAKTAADDLQKKLKDLETAATPGDTLAGDAILSHLADQGKLAALEEKKAVLDAYITALGGKEVNNPSLAQHRLYLIANLVNRGTERAAPPTAGILMQAEFYRLQLAAVNARIVRGKEAVQILERKRVSQQNELQDLQEASKYLKEAKCGSKPTDTCTHRLASALRSFALSSTLGRLPAEQLDYRLIDQTELAALDESQAALQQTDAVIQAALTQVVKLHEAGLKPDQISNLWQAIGLTAIAVRVK